MQLKPYSQWKPVYIHITNRWFKHKKAQPYSYNVL